MAKKFLSARRLKITELEREYLLKTRNVLKKLKPRQAVKVDGLKLGFNMSLVMQRTYKNDTKHLCGAAGCIKGWMHSMAIADGKMPTVLDTDELAKSIRDRSGEFRISNIYNSRALERLFYPSDLYSTMWKVTPQIAADAITSFLRGDKHINWGKAAPK